MQILRWLPGLVACALALVSLSGCTAGRTAYYSELGDRRHRRYEDWRAGRELEHAPRIEGELHPDDAVRLALQYGPNLLATLQMQAEARGRVIESYSAALPHVNLNAGYTRLDQISTIDLGFQTFKVGELDNYNVDLEIRQPIFRASAPVALRAARLFAYLSEETVREAKEGTVLQVIEAYNRSLLTARLVEVEEAALASAQAQLEAARTRRQEGMARDFDVLRAQVEVSNIEAELIERRKEEQSAFADLMMAMGVSQGSDVTLTGQLQAVDFSEPELEQAVAVAFQRRPDILQAMIEADMAKEGLTEVRTRYLPTLNFFYRHSWARPAPGGGAGSQWGDEWRAGLALNWSIFDGLARQGALVQAEAQLQQRNIMLDNAEQRAIKEIRDALQEIASSREMVKSQELNLQRAEETQRLIEEGYREGINTELELLDARSALTRTRGLYYRAAYRQTMAVISLHRATGQLVRFHSEQP